MASWSDIREDYESDLLEWIESGFISLGLYLANWARFSEFLTKGENKDA